MAFRNNLNPNYLIPIPYEPIDNHEQLWAALYGFNNYSQPPQIEDSNAVFRRVLPEVDDDEFFRVMPPGYRFCPTDVELITLYLLPKIKRVPPPRSRIHDANVYEFCPQHLADTFIPSQEKEWYFYTPRYKKYRGGKRPSRAAGQGFWKATGADIAIKDKGHVVGLRKSLVYFAKIDSEKIIKTDWKMHEYRVDDPASAVRDSSDAMKLDDYVLCKIYKTDPTPPRKKPKTAHENDGEALQQEHDQDDVEELQQASPEQVFPTQVIPTELQQVVKVEPITPQISDQIPVENNDDFVHVNFGDYSFETETRINL